MIVIGVSILLVRVQSVLEERGIPFAALLVVMAMGFIILEKREQMAHEISSKLGKLWVFASILLFRRDEQIFEIAKKQLFGILYVPLLLSYLILIRNGTDSSGAVWILFVLVVVFFGDIGALYAGTFFGKHKLYPALSPKKTIEGSLGGLSANIICGGLYKLIFLPELSCGISLLFFVFLGASGQVGDLFESGLKRVANITDSGGILPGHGGILDRADAAMYAAPLAYFFKAYLF